MEYDVDNMMCVLVGDFYCTDHIKRFKQQVSKSGKVKGNEKK